MCQMSCKGPGDQSVSAEWVSGEGQRLWRDHHLLTAAVEPLSSWAPGLLAQGH
jgi:hypothetical protein